MLVQSYRSQFETIQAPPDTESPEAPPEPGSHQRRGTSQAIGLAIVLLVAFNYVWQSQFCRSSFSLSGSAPKAWSICNRFAGR